MRHTYKAEVHFLEDPKTIACKCDGGCDWTGTADKLGPIGDAILTPGHASPAGRCPVCETLAYPAITDTDRLNFIEANTDKSLRNWKRKKWALIGFTSYPFEVFGRLRDAIDHAIKGYPE